MARAFDNASSQYLEYGSALFSAYPITIACWFNSDDDAAAQTLFSLSDSSASNQQFVVLMADGTLTNDPVRALVYDSGGQDHALSTTGYSTGTWHHACGIFTSATHRAAFIDGGSKGTQTDTRNWPSGLDVTTLGRRTDSAPGQYMSGYIAELGVWTVALSDEEVASLATGISPKAIRPGSLGAYIPLIRDNDEDIVGGYSFTAGGGPTIVEHPPVIYPAPPIFHMKASTAAADLNIDIGADESAYQGTGVRILTP